MKRDTASQRSFAVRFGLFVLSAIMLPVVSVTAAPFVLTVESSDNSMGVVSPAIYAEPIPTTGVVVQATGINGNVFDYWELRAGGPQIYINNPLNAMTRISCSVSNAPLYEGTVIAHFKPFVGARGTLIITESPAADGYVIIGSSYTNVTDNFVFGNLSITRTYYGVPVGPVVLEARPRGETNVFLSWEDGNVNPTQTVTISASVPVAKTANFGSPITDRDQDGLLDKWEINFGLAVQNSDASNWENVNSLLGDPDNDGLSNWQEYYISFVLYSNTPAGSFISSPIDADSDDDGMIDGYEYRRIGRSGTNGIPITQTNGYAVINREDDNGPLGNLDGDKLWNTTDGYELDEALNNALEYVGPDHRLPGTVETRAGALVGLAGTKAVTVYLYVANPNDTGDQTSSAGTDTDVDGFDDGFEYTWDEWQGDNQGVPIGDPLRHYVPFRFDVPPAWPIAAALTPLSGDAIADLAIVNSMIGTVTFFTGLNGGVYGSAAAEVSVGGRPVSILAATLDATGVNDDLVVADSANDSLTVLCHLTGYAFSISNVALAAGDSPTNVAAADFNGDGFNDLAVACPGSGNVKILFNDGTGNFSVVSHTIACGTPVAVAAGPLGGSPSNDIIVANSAGANAYILSSAGGTFTDPPVAFPISGRQSYVVMEDFNLDGTNDFAMTLDTVSSLSVVLATGPTTFAPPVFYSVGGGTRPCHMAAGFFQTGPATDTTGKDLAVVLPGINAARIFLNDGDGVFTNQLVATPMSPRIPSWVAVGDIDGDGTNEFVFTYPTNGAFGVFRNSGVGGMVSPGNYYQSAQVSVERRFHPAVKHVIPALDNSGSADYDLEYLTAGGVAGWYRDDMEYHAWDVGLGLESNKIVRIGANRRSSHPFQWDADLDGLPDGWEVVFGYDPWRAVSFGGSRVDGDLNPDMDGYAINGLLTHHAVYTNVSPDGEARNFNPAAGYMEFDPPKPMTGRYNNILEMLGARTVPAYIPNDPADRSTNPHRRDTDVDGMWDGWEFYVGLNPIDGGDSGDDPEGNPYTAQPGDGLTHSREFLCAETLVAEPSWQLANGVLTVTGNYTPAQLVNIQNRVAYVLGWKNKLTPTDPFNWDTDNDQMGDGGEQAAFNSVGSGNATAVSEIDEGTGEIVEVHYMGGGLNPATCDTDGDCLPDYWEYQFAGTPNAAGVIQGGMDGTTADEFGDPDGDGLLNFQEYMTGAVYHWQYRYNNGARAKAPGLVPGSYDPFDFFDHLRSRTPARPLGDAMVSNGGRKPKYFDKTFVDPMPPALIPFRYLTAAQARPGSWFFSTTEPNNYDTDGDTMDDYWEIYHMLDPIRSEGRDLVTEKFAGLPGAWELWDNDIQRHPWVNGEMYLDSDQDGLPNIYEGLQANAPQPQYYHTDPTPYWMSDISYEGSWANLYYWTGNVFSDDNYFWFWYHGIGYPLTVPQYLFDFEMGEGYDTDNDNLPDRAELVDSSVSVGTTDPLNSGDPIRRRALYLNGNAAARSFAGTVNDWLHFRTFTVEAWVRAINPASGVEQVIVERNGFYDNGNPIPYPTDNRANFRLGIDETGHPFICYDGAGFDPIFEQPRSDSSMVMQANRWYHLAGTYDGEAKMLTLYVDGQIAGATPTAEIPFTGYFGGNPQDNPLGAALEVVVPLTITVGAHDENPAGKVNGKPIVVTALAGATNSQPDLNNYFAGWVDEVRLWSGPRTGEEIRGNRMRSLTHADIKDINALLIGVGIVVSNGLEDITTEKQLLYVYGFDDLQDPDHSGTAPAGFELLSGYPPMAWGWGYPYPGSPWWSTAVDRSLVYNEYRYIPWIENTAGHVAQETPDDSKMISGSSNEFPNTTNPYMFQYVTEKDTGFEQHPFFELSRYADLLPLRWAQADEDIAMWDNGTVPATQPYDTDGDGMSDEWETANGLDPRDATGNNGGYGDPDGDGLSNLQEYLAGTNPQVFDTDGNGIGDYDSRSAPGTRTYGELYDDGDSISDLWEELYPAACNPLIYDANADPDEDGWDNFSEYMARTDPSDLSSYPVPAVTFTVRYEGTFRDGDLTVLGYLSPAMDGEPQVVYRPAGGGLMGILGEQMGFGDSLTMSGTLQNQPLYPGSLMVTAGTSSFTDDGNGNLIGTAPGSSGTIDYDSGDWTLNFSAIPGVMVTASVYAFIDNSQVTYPGRVVARDPMFGHLTQGSVWFHAFLDLDNDSTWSEGEPFGLGQYQPISIGWGPVDVELSLSDKLPGYGRFSWLETGLNQYRVQIRLVNLSGAPIVFNRVVNATPGQPLQGTRTYLHEGDYQYAGQFGLPSGGLTKPEYQWFINGVAGGYFTNSWNLGAAAPVPFYPVGSELVLARNYLEWTCDETNTQFRIELMSGVSGAGVSLLGAPYIDIASPHRSKTGHYKYTLPIYAGDGAFVNGVHSWRVTSINPTVSSAPSGWRNFTVNMQDTTRGAYSISGTTIYVGGALSNGTAAVVVQAFTSSGFSGVPVAQMTYGAVGAYKLLGLPVGTYYVRAFIDQNANRKLDYYESWGMVKSTVSPYAMDYTSGSMTVPPNVTLKHIVIRNRDTDNDNIADWYEMAYAGNLLTLGPGAIPGSPSYTDMDGDGLNDLEEYTYGSNPTLVDTDGDGIRDGDEHLIYGSNPTMRDTDGDGLDDLYEVNNGLRPNNIYDDNSGVPTTVKLNWDGFPDYNSGTDLRVGKDDSDNDGVSDLMEIAAGTDPLDGSSSGEIEIKGISLDAIGRPVVEWDMHANSRALKVRYNVQYTADMVRWTNVGTALSQGLSSGTVKVSDTISLRSLKKGFYRLQLQLE